MWKVNFHYSMAKDSTFVPMHLISRSEIHYSGFLALNLIFKNLLLYNFENESTFWNIYADCFFQIMEIIWAVFLLFSLSLVWYTGRHYLLPHHPLSGFLLSPFCRSYILLPLDYLYRNKDCSTVLLSGGFSCP